MKKMNHSLLRSGSYSLLGYAAQLGLAFISFLILVRLMPTYDFGVWVLFLTVASFADMGRMGLTQNAVVKFCVEENDAFGKIATAGLFLNTACTLLISFFLILIIHPLGQLWSAPELPALILWYPAIALLHGTARYFDFIHMAHHDFKGIFWSKTLFGLSFILGILSVWLSLGELSLWWLPILQLLASLPSLLFFACYRRSYLKWAPLDGYWVKKIFHFGKYVLGTNFSSMFFNKVDLMMVGIFLNPIAVGLYNVATRITNYVEVPMSGIAQAIYPRIAEAGKEESFHKVGKIYERSVGYLLALTLPIVLVVFIFPKPLVYLIAGKEYLSAAPILSILVIAVLVKPWGRLFGITLDAIGRPKVNFYLLFIGLIFNIILNALFISKWGIQGAAYATLISLWGTVLVGQWLIMKIIPIRQTEIWRRIWSFYRHPVTELKMQNL